MSRPWPVFRSVVRNFWLTLLLAILAAGFAAPGTQAKAKRSPQYYGSFTASGELQQTSPCVFYNFQSKWQFEGLFGRTRLQPAASLELSTGGAAGSIDWSVDRLCNGSTETGRCSVGLEDFFPPMYLYRAKGGLKIDFEAALAPVGCGTAQVQVYGAGLVAPDGSRPVAALGFIPSKKIGRKVIKVQISGTDTRTVGSSTRLSGLMSGTLTLTQRRPIQTLPF